MLIVGFVVVLVSHSLFSGDIDCRVLLPLPVSKRLVFACKALAVMVFTSVFAIAAHVAMMPPLYPCGILGGPTKDCCRC